MTRPPRGFLSGYPSYTHPHTAATERGVGILGTVRNPSVAISRGKYWQVVTCKRGRSSKWSGFAMENGLPAHTTHRPVSAWCWRLFFVSHKSRIGFEKCRRNTPYRNRGSGHYQQKFLPTSGRKCSCEKTTHKKSRDSSEDFQTDTFPRHGDSPEMEYGKAKLLVLLNGKEHRNSNEEHYRIPNQGDQPNAT